MPLLRHRPDGTRPSLSFFSQRSQNAEARPLTRQTPRSIPSPPTLETDRAQAPDGLGWDI